MAFSNSAFLVFISLFFGLSPADSFCQSSISDTLKITSWNLHLLPAPVLFRSKKKKRTDFIIENFNSNLENDVLIFQEVFHRKRRKQLIKGLSQTYPYYTKIVNKANHKLLKTNSGLVIFSKLPLEEIKTIKFNDCSDSDCMAFKGAQLVNIKFNQKEIFIINTHLNSEPPRSIAIEQMKLIKDSLAKLAYAKSPYVFIGGDFNINKSDSSNYCKMIKIFKTKNKFHFDISKNTTSIKKVKNTLDYILIYNSIESKINLRSYKYLIGPEWKKDNTKKVYGKTVGLSDHYPVQSILVFDKKNMDK
jgi:endonuclease/exonuclease/phosphatase family metal-dependent hydrolase